MLTINQDSEGHWTQIPLTRFQENSRESFNNMVQLNKMGKQEKKIIDRLLMGSAKGNEFGILQYGARIYSLRRKGFCIPSTKETFNLIQSPHEFGINDRCINCDTPRGKR